MHILLITKAFQCLTLSPMRKISQNTKITVRDIIQIFCEKNIKTNLNKL
jgi:hypothetical protein